MNRFSYASAALLVIGAAGVARTQPLLASAVHQTHDNDDVYAFPPPAQLRAMTLGWKAATVDMLWATLLVQYGTHWSEHRDFTQVPLYMDAMLGLEPDYAPAYRFADTMLAYRPLQGTEHDVMLARAYLERGTRVRPDDAKLWMQYGQFLAFVAPSFLRSGADIEAWRRDGANAMGHAVELGADADRALSAATLLTTAGATREAIRYLEHAYAFTEHPSMREVHEAIGRKLASLQATQVRDAADAAARIVDGRWRREMPFVPRPRYLLLGPAVDAALCAGLQAAHDRACARDWSEIVEPDEP
jgi:hypothetical protein